MVLATPPVAVVLTVLAGMGLFALLGVDPVAALRAYFVTPLTTLYGWGELAVKATPLALIGIGLAMGFRANVWNIGAEGQLLVGALAAGATALAFHGNGAAAWWLLPLMMVAGISGGAAYAAIPAFLKTRFNASEILVSLMLVYIAIQLASYLVSAPLRDPDGYNFPESRLFEESALLPTILSGTRMHLGVPLAVVAVAAGWFVIARTFIGFQLKVVGLTPDAARYAGFDSKRIVWITLLTAGGAAGLAGMFEVAGPIGQLTMQISPGYGFTAIIVAFLGRLHPVGIVLAAVLMAMTYLGGEQAQIDVGLPLAATKVFQGMLLFFLLGTDLLIHYRLRTVRMAAEVSSWKP